MLKKILLVYPINYFKLIISILFKTLNKLTNNSKTFFLFKEIYNLISRKNKLLLFSNLILMFISAFLELFSLFSIIPLLISLSNPKTLLDLEISRNLIYNIGFITEGNFFFLSCILIILVSLLSAYLKIINLWISELVSAKIGSELSCKGYSKILSQEYIYHIDTNSSELIASLTDHINGLVWVLRSILRIATSSIIIITVSAGLILLSRYLTIIVFISFSIIYLVISFNSKKVLNKQSQIVARKVKLQIKYLQEGIGSIRDIILKNSKKTFIEKYGEVDYPMRKALAKSLFIAYSPKFGIEGIAIISIVLLTLYLQYFLDSSIGIIPIIGTFGLASQKLLPAMQQLYNSWALVNSNIASVDEILKILKLPIKLNKQNKEVKQIFKLNSEIKFKNLSFKYKNSSKGILNKINLTISSGEKIGIIGETGSGKSTLIDILMGLLPPTNGEFLINENNLNSVKNRNKLYGWRKSIAHVPQDIFLIDASFAENIALGENFNEINMKRIYQAAKAAKIFDFIESTKYKFETKVGERGINLSGGQKQRLGIARALYQRPKVLVLDEATSALDLHTEKEVLKSIAKLGKDLTLIMIAHRLSTVSNCDKIVLLKSGTITKYGPPEEILKKSI